MAFPLTDEQRVVVDNRGGELLVSAAAGSGKTRVLVERLLDRVTKEGRDIDEFLVITYTRAAAKELRERIARELTQRLAQNPRDRHLRRQTTLVYRAQIATIHSFCAVLLRESGHLLGLDADFRLCDEGEGQVLKSRVLEDVLEEQYEDLDPEGDFACLVDTMAAGRDDSALAQIVLDIHGRIQSHPDPERWLLEQKEQWAFPEGMSAGGTAWGKLLMEEAAAEAEYCLDRLGQALDLCEEDEILHANYAESIQTSMEETEAFLSALEKDWDMAAECLPISFPTAGRKRGVADVEAAEMAKSLRTSAKKILEGIAERLEGKSEQLMDDMRLAVPAVRGLMDLVILFQRRYQKEKERRGILDFSDLEHMAVRLLTEPDGSPTPLAEYWSEKLAEVMVDEYQDTNQVQNTIFNAISHQGRKLFLVGDVKQSIYRFRLADPTIFLGKYNTFPKRAEARDGEPRTVVLTKNFRSRAQVLEGCNDLFRSVMSKQFGELDYTGDQELVPGAPFPEADRPVELLLLDQSEQKEREESDRQDKNLLEARCAAARIRRLLDEKMLIGPENGQRPLEPSDVMILLRSPGPVLHHYIRALDEQGIPWTAEGGEDIFTTTEINVALSLLRVVDNPRQDVPLIALLRSPIYGFSGDKLALLRAGARGDFYTAVSEAAEKGDEECRAFLEELEELRFGAGDRTCRQLIWHIYEKTNILGLFGAMEGGETRQNNLLTLYSLAGQLESVGCQSLFQFLLRLDRMREYNTKLPVGLPNQGAGVSIMTIHRSKGLEKPVVLVCGLARQFNRDDMKKPVLFHPVLGVGPRGLDRERMVEYPTLARKAVAGKLDREMMAEELRLLYVAMTRAQEKLILSMNLPEGVKNMERLRDDLTVPIAPMALRRQSCMGSWVLLHALTRPEAEPLRRMAGLPHVVNPKTGPKWNIEYLDGSQFEQAPGTVILKENGSAEKTETENRDELLRRLRWTYPNAAAAQIPSKLTATQIKGRAVDREAAENTVSEKQNLSIRRPEFITESRGLTGAQRGIALHLAMQYLTMEGSDTPEAVKDQVDRLVAGGFMTKLQGEAADPFRLSAFWASPLGRAMSHADSCRREFKFSVLLPARDYYGPEVEEGEKVLLQGVIDAWFEQDGEITLVDFKSDRVTPDSQKLRAQEYLQQMDAYSRALLEMTGKTVKHRYLWFFNTDSAQEI